MFRMIGATLVALYCIAIVFGDESRRPAEVTRAQASPVLDFDFSDWLVPVALAGTGPVHVSDISDDEAVEIALASARAIRENREAPPMLGGLVAAVSAPAETVEKPLDDTIWYVTGSLVNVRSGPGTGNPVVTQVAFGEGAEVLSGPSDGWIEIKPRGAATTGWISARFLAPESPG